MTIIQRVLAVATIAGLAATCHTGDELLGPFGRLQGLLVSEPVGSQLGSGNDTVFVSLPPGSAPGGIVAEVSNVRTGSTTRAPMSDGGFDPVRVAAAVGDTIEVVVYGRDGSVYSRELVPVGGRRRPVVVRTYPPPRKTDVPVNAVIEIVFSEPVAPASITRFSVHLNTQAFPVEAALVIDVDDPTTVRLKPRLDLAPGTVHSLTVTTQVRDVTGDALDTPVELSFVTASTGALSFSSVSAGGHTCALTVAGQPFCWGPNWGGELGTGWFTLYDSVPRGVAASVAFADVVADGPTCGRARNGETYCWPGDGDPLAGAYGRGEPSPQPIGWSFDIVAVGGAACGITGAGRVYCWGYNDGGVLGVGSSESQVPSPLPIVSALTFQAVSLGGSHACAITSGPTNTRIDKETSDLYCWGANGDGQVGDGTTADRVTPVRIAGELRFATVTAGSAHTCGLGTNGALYCWGSNGYGQVGRGGDRRVPVLVAPLKRFTAVDAGGLHTCAIAVGGEAYCWGWNGVGQLGIGVIGGRAASPTPVVGGLRFSTLSAGSAHTCGLTTDGDVYCWGSNSSGQIGDGTTTDRPEPTRVVGQR